MKIFGRARDLIAYIYVLYSFTYMVYALKRLKSDRRLVHNMGWKPRSPRRSLSHIRTARGLSPIDSTSYSRPELAIITHIAVYLNVDFQKQVFCGKAILNFYVLEDVDELPLDINCLKIESIMTEKGLPLKYEIEGEFATDRSTLTVGSKLRIKLSTTAVSGDKLKISIIYTTDPKASALTWLKPSQTSGKKHPYVFSQSSPIYGRSILPCQDSPTVRFTYYAEVTAPEELTVLMSALKGAVIKNKSIFNQPVPVPARLFAIAVGAFESKTIGPRSKLWAEKADLERSAEEFSEVEAYVHAAELLCGPYDWTEYNILVMPPAFPHGATENPCLTFVSPTVVVGDKSLAGIIIHEIMHSWTGNAVSIKNYDHFWLSEGFAVFLERKVAASLIKSTVKAKRSRDFSSLLGLQELTDTIEIMGATNQYSKIVLDLDGVHPADALSRIQHEKGALFLRYLEDVTGGPKVFNKFIKAYVRNFSMTSLDTDEFKKYFLKRFRKKVAVKSIDWNTWLYGTGMPPVIPNYDRTLVKPVESLVAKMDNANFMFSNDDVKDFSVGQIIYFLQMLIKRPPMSIKALRCLGDVYNVSSSENKEIMFRWLRLCIRSRDESKLDEVFKFVNSLGRLSYVRPLYRELYAWKKVRKTAIQSFLGNEKYMSHITVYNLKKDLHFSDKNI